MLTWLCYALVAAAYAVAAVQRHDRLGSNALDLGYEDQTMWNTLHGRLFQFTIYSGGAFSLPYQAPLDNPGHVLLAYHAELLLAPLSLLYALVPDVRAALVLQALAVCAGSLAAYGLAARRLSSRWAGLCFALAYLASPFLEAELLSDFHAAAFASALLMLLFYCVERRWTVPALVVGVLTALAKEDAAVAVAMLGGWALLARRRHGPGAALLLIGAGVALFDFGWLIPHFSPTRGSPFLSRYGYLGANPAAMLRTFLLHPQALAPTLGSAETRAYLATILGSTAGLCLLAPAALAVALPALAVNALSTFPWMRTGMAHYSALVLPVLIAASIEGVRTSLLPSPRRRGEGRREVRTVLLALAVALAAVVTHSALGVGLWPRAADPAAEAGHAQLLARFLTEIPPDAPVSASSALVPHLSHRSEVYVFPNVVDAQDVLVDLTTVPFPLSWGEQRRQVLELLRGGDFGVADAADGYVLLRRGAPAHDLPAAALDFTQGRDVAAGGPPLATFGGGLALVGAAVGDGSVLGLGRQEELALDWRLLAASAPDARLAVWSGERPPSAPPDFAGDLPALVWRPAGTWRVGEVVRVAVPPLGVSHGGRLAIGWLVPDAAGQWRPLACVDAGGRPCLYGSRFVVPVSPNHSRLGTAGLAATNAD